MVVYCTFIHLQSNGVISKMVLHDLDFQTFKILNISISETMIASAKFQNHICRFEYLTTNDPITKVASDDLDLLF